MTNEQPLSKDKELDPKEMTETCRINSRLWTGTEPYCTNEVQRCVKLVLGSSVSNEIARNVKRVLFIPYALHNRDEYTNVARTAFNAMGYELDGIHEKPNAVDAVKSAEAVFIGGGNSFRLLKTLYDENIVAEINRRVTQDSIPYIGSSAGSNVATISINTTNDMPIVYPPSFNAIGLVPFNINAHYLDPDTGSKHMGETREQRINQYHEYEDAPPVLGIREGCIIHVEGDKATIEGKTNARLFTRGKEPVEYEVGSDISFLLKS